MTKKTAFTTYRINEAIKAGQYDEAMAMADKAEEYHREAIAELQELWVKALHASVQQTREIGDLSNREPTTEE